VEKIAALSPHLVTFNGSSFDFPVLRYRAMVHGVAAPGLATRPYFNRYTDDAIDLCDVLSSFSSQAKTTLHELCRVMGLPGKPEFQASEANFVAFVKARGNTKPHLTGLM
jgi:3'-5' exonuclease